MTKTVETEKAIFEVEIQYEVKGVTFRFLKCGNGHFMLRQGGDGKFHILPLAQKIMEAREIKGEVKISQ